MSDSESLLKKAFEFIDKNIDSDSGDCIVLMGVEFSSEGLPTGRAVKVHGTPSATLASLTLLEILIADTKKDVLDRIQEISSTSSSAKNVFDKTELTKKLESLHKLGLLDAFVDSLGEDEDSQRIKDTIKELKKRFGS